MDTPYGAYVGHEARSKLLAAQVITVQRVGPGRGVRVKPGAQGASGAQGAREAGAQGAG